MRCARYIGALALLPLLGSCATGYQASGITGGYSEKKLSESAYEVSFNGNGFASSDRVYYFWMNRCAELTARNGFDLFVLRRKERVGVVPPSRPGMRPAAYQAPIIVPMPGNTITTYSSSGVVLMYHGALPDEVPWAFDARAVLALLKPFIDSNGNTKPPTAEALVTQGFVGHGTISIGEHATTAAATGSDAAHAPRPAADVRRKLETLRIALYEVFYRRASREHETRPQQVTLRFTITPNGDVSNPAVTESTLVDREFTDRLAQAIGSVTFGPADAAPTAVSGFDFIYTPNGTALPAAGP